MKKILVVFIILLSLNGMSQTTTKAQRYEIYKAKCYATDTVTIKLSGYLKLDTLVLTSLPTKPTYYGKIIVNKVKVSSTRSLVVVLDTIWNNLKTPLYAYNTTPSTVVPVDYNKTSHRVYKNKKVIMRMCKPVSYTIWTKNELYYEQLLATIKTNFNL